MRSDRHTIFLIMVLLAGLSWFLVRQMKADIIIICDFYIIE